MPEETVVASLVSKADTSGFEKFESATTRLNQRRREGIQIAGDLLQSERRVRTNLIDTVAGLAQARTGTDAVAIAVTHLSEVFKIGLGATVIAGVAGAIISQFSKAQETIDQMSESVKKTGQDLDDFLDKLRGVEQSPQRQAEKETSRFREDLEKRKKELQAFQGGFFSMAALGASKLTGGIIGGDTEEKYRQEVFGIQAAEAKLRQAEQLVRNPVTFTAKRDAAAERRESDRVQEAFTRQGIELERQDQERARARVEISKKAGEEERRQQEQATRARMEADKAAAEEQKRLEHEAAKENEKGSDRQVIGFRTRLQTFVGGQRTEGGGGRAYSVMVRQ